jgi:hypothetical protein
MASYFDVGTHLEEGLAPVRAVTQQPQVGQRLLGGARLALHLRQLVACNYHNKNEEQKLGRIE